jgi:hypothetical protein
VAFDNRSPIPVWLSDFTDTGYDLTTDVSFSLYAKDFPPGHVTLGPSHSGSMYTVIINTMLSETQNESPTADAGKDQTVDTGDTVVLNGFYSLDPDDGIATYQWKQIEGSPVALSDSWDMEPYFVCPKINAANKTLTFKLTVTDYSGAAASDTVNIYVNDVASNAALDISNLSNASSAEYQIAEGLADGNACYIDRSYTYSNVPDFLQGAVYIKTANNDKKNMADPLLSFDVNTDATVYVAFDNRSPIPVWLSDFTDTGYDLTTDVSFSIYAKDFPPGYVTLGPSHSESMYTVIIK